MATARPVKCSENEELVSYFLSKRQEIAESNGLSENIDLTLSMAYRGIADCKTPVRTIKGLSRIKGVGKWILRLMQGFFPNDTDKTRAEAPNGKKTKGPKRYVPQKNSVAYALLITLYREMSRGKVSMMKQELIDAADGSGLSRTSIAREKGIGKPGYSQKDWYTGWSCMKGLIAKGLVAKSSCPAKYMLTDEGKEVARDCLVRSGMVDPTAPVSSRNESNGPAHASASDNFNDGFSQRSALPFSNANQSRGCLVEPFGQNVKNNHPDSSESVEFADEDYTVKSPASVSSDSGSRIVQPCASSDHPDVMPLSGAGDLDVGTRSLAMPPHIHGENFEDIYDVVLILDDRENFGISCRKMVENIKSQFNIQVEMRRLPVGDGTWLARHQHLGTEYVLDFIVERKRVDDLHFSIKDNRYRDQKLRLLRCGIQKLIYLVEGDPNACEASESVKTACFTTEILEGFDVQRTSGLAETVKKYGHLTQAIRQLYKTQFSNKNCNVGHACPTYEEFLKRCQDLDKMTISDVFGLQLMQVPQVTEEAALAILGFYPTLLSLVQAYSLLDGDVRAQEEMLKKKSNLINSAASRNIFRLIWG